MFLPTKIQAGKMYRIDEPRIRNSSTIVHATAIPDVLKQLMTKSTFTEITITQVGVVAINKNSGVKYWVDPSRQIEIEDK